MLLLDSRSSKDWGSFHKRLFILNKITVPQRYRTLLKSTAVGCRGGKKKCTTKSSREKQVTNWHDDLTRAILFTGMSSPCGFLFDRVDCMSICSQSISWVLYLLWCIVVCHSSLPIAASHHTSASETFPHVAAHTHNLQEVIRKCRVKGRVLLFFGVCFATKGKHSVLSMWMMVQHYCNIPKLFFIMIGYCWFWKVCYLWSIFLSWRTMLFQSSNTPGACESNLELEKKKRYMMWSAEGSRHIWTRDVTPVLGFGNVSPKPNVRQRRQHYSHSVPRKEVHLLV